jgi:hypothetical protein
MALFRGRRGPEHRTSFLDGRNLSIVTVDWYPIKKRFPCQGVFSKNIIMQENAYQIILPEELDTIKGN